MAISWAEGSPTVATVLLPVERPRVDAAGSGCFAVVHRDSIPEAVRIVRERPVDAVLVSVHRCGPEQVEVLGQPRPRISRYSHRRPRLTARLELHRNVASPGCVRCSTGGGRYLAYRVEPSPPSGGPTGYPGRRAHPGANPRSSPRGAARCPPLRRSTGSARTGNSHGNSLGAAALCPAQHTHVPLRSRRSPIAQELSGGHSAAPCLLPF